MDAFGKVPVVLAAALLLASAAPAQPPGGFGGRPGPVGPGMLLQNDAVLKELKLDREQIDKAREVLKTVQEKYQGEIEKFRDLPREERLEKSQKLNAQVFEEVYKALGDALKPEQLKRLKQIDLQQRGPRVFAFPEIQKGLKLSEEQIKRIDAIVKDSDAAFGKLLTGSSPEEAREKFLALRKETMEKAQGVLKEDQKKIWKEMLGEPFEVRIEPRRRGEDRPDKAPEEKPPAKPSTARTLRLPETPYRYADLDLPAHFRAPAARRFDNTPSDNPVTDHGATLGRVLFYDTRLSANNTVACGSCHHQSRAFVDGERFSKGFENKRTDRNAPSLVNLRYYARGRFFWDERARSLEDQVLMPIQSKTEMGNDLTKVVAILGKDDRYPELFSKAFGDREVTQGRISRAMAQFLRSMVSYQSKYDEGRAKARSLREDFDNFTAQENRGKGLFLNSCAICHLPLGQDAHFILDRPVNNGLDADTRNTDGGVGDITLSGADLGRFKSPSLRNVEFTAPYMHDGRLANLEAVIDHYNQDVKAHPNVDPRVRRRLNLSSAEKSALVAFLKTLSDQKFITDPKFADPFQ